MIRASLPSNPPPVITGSVFILGVLFVTSEILLTYDFLTEALWGYVLTIGLCTVLPVYLRDTVSICLAFVLLPVFRLVNLTMPVFVELTLYWVLLIYLPFIFVGGYILHRGKFMSFNYKLRSTLLWLPVTLIGGIVLAEVNFRFGGQNLLVLEPNSASLAFLTGVVLIVATTEELIFRGILQGTLDHHFGPIAAIVVASALFSMMYTPFGQTAVGLGFLSGVLYGGGYAYSRSIVVPVAFHAAVNVLVFVIFPVQGTFIQMVN